MTADPEGTGNQVLRPARSAGPREGNDRGPSMRPREPGCNDRTRETPPGNKTAKKQNVLFDATLFSLSSRASLKVLYEYQPLDVHDCFWATH